MPQAITKEKEINRRLKISSALKGIKKLPFSEETKIKMRISRKGKKPNLGKRHTKEAKEKICKAREKQGSNVWNKGKSYFEIRGDKHWNWQGGITSKNNKIRNSLEIKLWRKAIFERDNFIDQKTGQRGGQLVAHHINNFADYPELRFAIDNGITLLKETHIEFHKIYGKKNNTREQLNEFLYGKNL